MATFRYKAMSGKGGSNGAGGLGTIDAPDRPAALRQLMSKGITPVSLEVVGANAGAKNGSAKNGSAKAEFDAPPKKDASGPGSGAAAKPKRPAGVRATTMGRHGRVMSLPETASFIRELATAVQAGLSLVPALRTLAKSGRSAGQKRMLDHLIMKVEAGSSLADACASWGKPFNELIINLIRAGEASGRLGDVLHQAADLLERDLHLRRALMSAIMYPAMLTFMVGVTIVVVVTFIVPTLLKPLAGKNVVLPLPTRIVQGFAAFMGSYWWVLILAILALVIAWVRARAVESSRLAIDKVLLKIPLVGALLRDAAVARFTRTLGTLAKAGLPVLAALRLTGATLTNLAMREAIEHVCDQVASGKTIAGPLEATRMFPPLLVQIVGLGERSGKLPELLMQAAGALEGRTETRVKVFTAVLPVLLIIVMAVLVGGIMASILLPLLQLGENIN